MRFVFDTEIVKYWSFDLLETNQSPLHIAHNVGQIHTKHDILIGNAGVQRFVMIFYPFDELVGKLLSRLLQTVILRKHGKLPVMIH